MEFLSLESLQELLQSWGYVVIFTGMLLENAGVPIPGETLALLGGYSAGSGQLQVWGVLLAAGGGAILGDNLGYWIGRRAGWPLILQVGRALGQSPAQMEQLRDRFQRHAGKSVLLGRFVALLRVVAGPMAGAVRMPYRRFLICNAAGAILWACTMVSLAWLGGRWIPLATMVKGVVQFGIGALVVLVLVLLIPRLLARLEARLEPSAPEETPAPASGQPTP
jgi:membrane protein DedA with SNARE-associated domain